MQLFISKNKFKDASKPEDEKKPDYTASIKDTEGFTKAGAAWIKKNKNDETYLSLTLDDKVIAEFIEPTKEDSTVLEANSPF